MASLGPGESVIPKKMVETAFEVAAATGMSPREALDLLVRAHAAEISPVEDGPSVTNVLILLLAFLLIGIGIGAWLF